MKTRNVVRWGFRCDNELSPEDSLMCWYHDDDVTWHWSCYKEDATPMDVKKAVSLMQLYDSMDGNRVFMMEFVE